MTSQRFEEDGKGSKGMNQTLMFPFTVEKANPPALNSGVHAFNANSSIRTGTRKTRPVT